MDISLAYAEKKLEAYIQLSDNPLQVSLELLELSGVKAAYHRDKTETSPKKELEKIDFSKLLEKTTSLKASSGK